MLSEGKRLVLILIAICFTTVAFAQTATVYGNIRDEVSSPLSAVTIKISVGDKGTFSDEQGNFEITVPSDKQVTIKFSHIGYEDFQKTVSLKPGQRFPLYVVLESKPYVIDSITVENSDVRDQAGMVKINPKNFDALPSASGGVEAMLKVMGASSNNELSSQYSVRGGNYDENLVYVNDFEIFRPFLIRSSQQEGLSFVNPDMTGSLLFSAGGFQSKYGDKMSSVLDISYRKPTKFGGSVSLSLLGGSLFGAGRAG